MHMLSKNLLLSSLKSSAVLARSSVLLGAAFLLTTPSLGMENPTEEESPCVSSIFCISTFPDEVMAQCIAPEPQELKKMALVSKKWNAFAHLSSKVYQPIHTVYADIKKTFENKNHYIAVRKVAKFS